MDIYDIIKKSRDQGTFLKNEIVNMLSFPPDSMESYLLMAEANRISKDLTKNKAEVHAQFSLNLSPCTCNCLFCSFAGINGIFHKESEISPEQAVSFARQFEKDGANAVFVMCTGNYPFGKFIEFSIEIKRNLRPDTVLIANVGDQSSENAKKLKDAGYTGVYHALRLREGRDSGIPPENRKKSICNFKNAGLRVGTCVEPIGPEHTNEEIADLIIFTGSIDPSFSGAARRITIPGTEIAKRGMISELRMSQIVAITRIVISGTVMGNCTHEPCTLGGAAGANLFWAETGANPRDVEEKTEEARGETIDGCRNKFRECGWDTLEGPSRYYRNK